MTAAGAGAAGLAASRLVGAPGAARGESGSGVFAHGVASGDPLPDRVILWTRVTPSKDAAPGSGRGPAVTVRWEIAASRDFSAPVASGTVTTDAGKDHTVKVDAGGLSPDTSYWYRFRAAGAVSPTGRTRTAPATGAAVHRVRFGVVSCANWEAGYFGAYRELAERSELSAVVHLGDYLYEYGAGEYGGKNGPVRPHRPAHPIVSLADYRIRHAQYKTDPDLRAAHAMHPFICTWDDHESADNAYTRGAENHDPATQGSWARRRAAAERAYYEWMPVRPQVTGTGRHLYRRLRYGTLLELTMLDLRTYRDKQASATSAKVDDAGATITGRAQMRWLTGGIETSETTWQIVGNPVMMSPTLVPPLDAERTSILTELLGLPRGGVPANTDAWDGYPADRKRLLDAVDRSGRRNTVFITGDIHMSWACEVPRDAGRYPAAGTVATEFVVTSVTSNNLDDMLSVPEHTLGTPAAAAIMASNRHTRWVDTDAHGYAVLTVSPAAAQMDWYFTADRAQRRAPFRHAQSWRVAAGSRRLTRAAGPA
ncbi:MAG: alkaline phosphatase D family protein [Gordonia sp. (in: high G+C Gram-positive bacteria)]|uniref:alkaline phosphatase D family protein n=1 Tax=Gordonia sp. (in: high G+C Gram-positive bacteria) TaxID=84139 RepID=UPI0039E6F52F